MRSESSVLSFQSLVLLNNAQHCSMPADSKVKSLVIWFLLFNHVHWLYPCFSSSEEYSVIRF
jgi:hypothetical protein